MRGVKKKFVPTFFVATKRRKIFGAIYKKFIELSTKKIVIRLSKIWGWDPGSGKNLFRIPDPGFKKALAPGSGSATLHIRFVEISTTHIP
jgi:hypothetical protein